MHNDWEQSVGEPPFAQISKSRMGNETKRSKDGGGRYWKKGRFKLNQKNRFSLKLRVLGKTKNCLHRFEAVGYGVSPVLDTLLTAAMAVLRSRGHTEKSISKMMSGRFFRMLLKDFLSRYETIKLRVKGTRPQECGLTEFR